ncbi:MAG: nucleotide exchange factor GrpE [Sedimentisphaerales bacterium]|nr:nucleotide exchange factor GrpE [Sedimentisphaerales bacterium]
MKHKNKNDKPSEQHDVHEIQKELHELKEQFGSLQKEKTDVFAQLQRVSADYLNYQKRSAKQIADTTAYEKESIIKSLLPALDNFEHALAKAPTAETADALMKGMQMVYQQVVDILKLHGVEQITALGQQFDPEIHLAVTQTSDPAKPENIVLHEIARGYKISSRVIRHAKVVVNKLAAPAPKEDTPPQPTEEPVADDETTDTQ